MNLKKCIKCSICKGLNEFYKRKDSPDGFRNECKKCNAIHSKERSVKRLSTIKYTQIDFKTCSKCKVEKNIEMFQTRKDSKDNHRSYCKECQSKQKKEYTVTNKDKITKAKKEYQSKNVDKLKKYYKEYYNNNRDARKIKDKQRYDSKKNEINQKNRESYHKNKRERLKKCKEYVLKHKEKTAEYQKKYSIANSDKIKEYKKIHHKDYYLKNKNKILNCKSEWLKTSRGKISSAKSRHKRRSLDKKLRSDFTLEEWNFLKLFFNNKCAYCGADNTNLEKDHFIPVTKYGEYTKNNIVCACKSCNASKGNKDFFDWYRNQEFYSIEKELKILNYLIFVTNQYNTVTTENIKEVS
jgi:hypothetical protein